MWFSSGRAALGSFNYWHELQNGYGPEKVGRADGNHPIALEMCSFLVEFLVQVIAACNGCHVSGSVFGIVGVQLVAPATGS